MPTLTPDLPRKAVTERSLAESFRLPFPFDCIPRGISLWHLTSLDAPTVAIVWTLAFAWAAGLQLPPWPPIALGLAAWAAYIADRLLDARGAYDAPLGMSRVSPLSPGIASPFASLRARHHFHWKHRRIFAPLALAAACAVLLIALAFLPRAAVGLNTALAAAGVAYFAAIHTPARNRARSPWLTWLHRFHLSKELAVGLLFTLGCAAPVWARTPPAQRLELLLPIAAFAALAWLNCHAIEGWESTAPGPSADGRGLTFRPGLALAAGCLIAALIPAALGHRRPAALLATAAVSASLLALLDRAASKTRPLTLRACADLALLAPLLLLAVSA